MKAMEAGDLVKLKKPEFIKTFGQGEPPEGITIRTSGIATLLKYGSVFKLSESVEGIADMSKKKYPLLSLSFAETIKDQLTKLKSKSNNNKNKE